MYPHAQYAFPWGDEDVESIKNKGSSEWTLMMSDNLSLVSMVAGVNRGEALLTLLQIIYQVYKHLTHYYSTVRTRY